MAGTALTIDLVSAAAVIAAAPSFPGPPPWSPACSPARTVSAVAPRVCGVVAQPVRRRHRQRAGTRARSSPPRPSSIAPWTRPRVRSGVAAAAAAERRRRRRAASAPATPRAMFPTSCPAWPGGARRCPDADSAACYTCRPRACRSSRPSVAESRVLRVGALACARRRSHAACVTQGERAAACSSRARVASRPRTAPVSVASPSGLFPTSELAARARATLTDSGYESVPREVQTRDVDGLLGIPRSAFHRSRREALARIDLRRGSVMMRRPWAKLKRAVFRLGVLTKSARVLRSQSASPGSLQPAAADRGARRTPRPSGWTVNSSPALPPLEGQKFPGRESELEFRVWPPRVGKQVRGFGKPGWRARVGPKPSDGESSLVADVVDRRGARCWSGCTDSAHFRGRA